MQAQNDIRALNELSKYDSLSRRWFVSCAAPDQLDYVQTIELTHRVVKHMPQTLAVSGDGSDNSGAGYPHKQPILGKGSAAFFWRGSR